jgi:hypothetical protein
MYNTIEALDQHCLDNAVMFTAIRGRNPMSRVRMEFATLDEAKAYAVGFGDKRTLIYAVTAQGRSAPILTA